MKLLELFKGTGSVGKAATALGYTDIVSLDMDAKFKPDIVSDIMDWDYTVYPPGYFDVIWASPPCTYYTTMQNIVKVNKAKKGIPWDLEEKRSEADKIVRKTLDIIDYFKPRWWFMENPQSGALKSRDVVKDIPYVDGDYCKYGYPYRKRTRFWTNSTNQLLLCKHDCLYSVGNKHISAIGHNRSNSEQYQSINSVCREQGLSYTKEQRYSIPQPLLMYLLPKIKPKIKVQCKRK